VPRKVAEEARVELAHRLHLVVRHRQSRVYGGGRAQEGAQDLQLIRGPGGPEEEAEDAWGEVSDEQGEMCECAGPRRAK
jgi:hypothetical protein